ncbi:adenylate/guanylate cyclase domain-containing protein [Lewinella sp. JB7]|uniref:adenylate/guanylate cyclase domain-containing protein n=1 Tax=Lewinella sp. JB7 TaxID=2962887 RepID=UPI0020C979A9|nr:adenylate/guanylate cyclase domain-containing protein [Lewinella sp. JB7]MCP9236293.1 adenylate/guanylate cyclase domain-containing protein [Lewinella sp. JB7]
MLSARVRRNWYRILPFGIIWLLTAATSLLIEWVAYGGTFPSTETAISPNASILAFALLSMLCLGLLVGYVELNHLNKLFTRQSFFRKSVYKFLIYFVFIHLVVLVTYPIAASMEMNTGLLDPRVWTRLWQYLNSLVHLSTALQLGVAITLTIVYAQVSEVIGHVTLLNSLAGTYHRPRVENRIFLFSDMRSSTAIAEALGHQRFFHLLKAYYADLADAVVRHGGEVYLYVGDEMIVSWKLADGLNANNCLRCFFAMREDLRERADWYKATFGVVPKFKAGLHYGSVTTGEIGVVKKHIMFTGDVLNVTSRMQSLCNSVGVDLLVSGPLVEKLPLGSSYVTRSVGCPELRGRREEVELFTVEDRG